MLQRRAFGQLAIAICLLAEAASALPSDPLPEAIRTLEAAGRLAEASKEVNELKPPLDAEDLKAQVGLIAKTIDLLGVVDAYVTSGLTSGTDTDLAELISAEGRLLGTVIATTALYVGNHGSPDERSSIRNAARRTNAQTRADLNSVRIREA